MTAAKWIFGVLFGLGSAGSLAMALTTDGVKRAPLVRTAPALALRPFPLLVASASAAPGKVSPATPEVALPPEPVAAPPQPVAKPPAPVVKAPEPVAKPPPPVAKLPEPAAKPPEPVAKAPEPVVAAPKVPPVEGMLNLRATDTADVYLDGKKLGGSPLLGIKARVGNHKVRFDCYDAAGNTVAGPLQTIAVKADAEVDVEYPCPVE